MGVAGVVTGYDDEITAGTAQVLIDLRDVGYCEGKLGCAREVNNLIVKAGIPRSTVKTIFLEEDWNLEIPMIQVGNMDNLSIVMGLPKRVQAATPVTVSDAETYTFANRAGTPFQAIAITHSGQRAYNLSSVVVTNTAGSVTYDVDDDYIVDAETGLIYRNPSASSAITAGQSVKVTYHYTPAAYEEILLGKNTLLESHRVDYIHTAPDGWLLHYCFWKCQGDGSIDISFDSGASAPMVALGKLKAQNDQANHPSSSTQGPTGFIRYISADEAEAYLATIEVIE